MRLEQYPEVQRGVTMSSLTDTAKLPEFLSVRWDIYGWGIYRLLSSLRLTWDRSGCIEENPLKLESGEGRKGRLGEVIRRFCKNPGQERILL